MSKKFYTSNPAYIIVSGDPQTPADDIKTAVNTTFAAVRAHGRNPVLIVINDNTCSSTAQSIAKEQHAPIISGDVASITKELDGKRLRKDHIQMILFQTPEYAGSEEALDLLYGCRQFNGTLRMWSVFHKAWLNSQWNVDWVIDFNNKFLRTLNSYRMDNTEKRALFKERMIKLQKYPTPALFKRKNKQTPFSLHVC